MSNYMTEIVYCVECFEEVEGVPRLAKHLIDIHGWHTNDAIRAAKEAREEEDKQQKARIARLYTAVPKLLEACEAVLPLLEESLDGEEESHEDVINAYNLVLEALNEAGQLPGRYEDFEAQQEPQP